MKSILLLLMLSVSTCLFSQQPAPGVNADYLKKSKKQKTAGWILLIGGIVTESIGIALDAAYPCEECYISKPPLYPYFLISGGAMMAGSIPLFIAASKNKKKTTGISFKMEKIPTLLQQVFVYRSYPTLSLNISIN